MSIYTLVSSYLKDTENRIKPTCAIVHTNNMWNLTAICLIIGAIWIQTGAASSSESLEKREAPCKQHVIQAGDTCPNMAKANGISTDDIEKYNTRTFAWHGCGRIKQGNFICLGPGEPPWPVAMPHATCGPQVPGTVRPVGIVDWSKIGLMNPCPSGQCVCSHEPNLYHNF